MFTSSRGVAVPHTTPLGLKDRKVHLVDLENVGAGRVTDEICQAFLVRYYGLGIIGTHDLVIVGVSQTWLGATTKLPLKWRRVVGPAGVKNAADDALLAAMPEPRRLPTFSGLVIVSRDNIFRLAADIAHQHGLTVTTVSTQAAGEGRELAAAADRHLYLERRTVQLAA